MATSVATDSQSIFDIMNLVNIFRYGPMRPPPIPDETHRYYACKKGSDTGLECKRMLYREALNKRETHSLMFVKKGCPEINDKVILSWKAGELTRIVSD
jgi:ribosomal protein L33